MCPKCTRDVETSEHIFRGCPSIAEKWRKLDFEWPNDIANGVESYIRNVDVVQRKLHVRRVENESWKPPKDPFLKINFDAAFQGNDRRSYSGAVSLGDRFRDSIGDGRRGRLVSDKKDESCTYTIKRGVDERWEYLSGRVCVGLCERCDGQRSARMTVGGKGKKWWRCSLMASQETLMGFEGGKGCRFGFHGVADCPWKGKVDACSM
ncbi:hypothetical protein Gotri_023053 [Gossypium trilobum]|uniref:Reverse transcriptase zinc-binding domain-containing protein n=1 Tax=Gossypium trilobum TaxID=34281 RepID=A0A7J9DHS3_9ROSI|nr:hypothetical protein [Gossypium trilobum]